jgi:hypothetical protein
MRYDVAGKVATQLTVEQEWSTSVPKRREDVG